MCKIVPCQPKNLPKGRHFTYLEDPGIVNGYKKFVEIEYILLLIFAVG